MRGMEKYIGEVCVVVGRVRDLFSIVGLEDSLKGRVYGMPLSDGFGRLDCLKV
ncbi:hypothetical protein MCO_00623 [Bartonella sp. DB5-6]|nr:hypothetical protein MCO_00623 [Bartonella sp. DB5-6]